MSLKYRSASGQETVIAGLTPGGNLEAGAVATREGTVTTDSVNAGSILTQSITFDSPMPDADYEVLFHQTETFALGRVLNQTINGFDIIVRNDGAAAATCTLDYYAFKVYEVQHAQQNAEDIAIIKAMIPADASSANKLVSSATMTNITTPLTRRVANIEDVIPSGASLSNKLVTEDNIATDAEHISYDNTTSGLTATDVQDAIDEIANQDTGHVIEDSIGLDLPQRGHLQFNGAYLEDDQTNDRSKVSIYRELEQAEYDALPTAERKGMIVITDAEEGTIEGEEVLYSNSTSHLTSTNMQDAMDEIVNEIHTVEIESLATGVTIERCGKARKFNCATTITTSSSHFNGLNGLLAITDYPKANVNGVGVARWNDKYYPVYVCLLTDGTFVGFGLDTTISSGYTYLTGTPSLTFSITYFV